MRRFGPVQQKMLIALLGGIALGCQHSPKRYFRLLLKLRKEWKAIDQKTVTRSLRRLSDQKLVSEEVLSDGSIRLVLTTEGRRQAHSLALFGPTIRLAKPKKWDGKWRVISFDIPENSRAFRRILREHLYETGFYQLQKSVFVSPYPYEKPFAELIRLYEAESFVRIMTVYWLDNESELKHVFFDRKKSPSKKGRERTVVTSRP
ncbi:MAG: hypothetical protein WCL23_04045 [Candidatus Moraniibacteriota bacterium]